MSNATAYRPPRAQPPRALLPDVAAVVRRLIDADGNLPSMPARFRAYEAAKAAIWTAATRGGTPTPAAELQYDMARDFYVEGVGL